MFYLKQHQTNSARLLDFNQRDNQSRSPNDSLNSSNDSYRQNEPDIKNIYGKCKICNDDASGNHYGVVSCEPCKVMIELLEEN